MTITPAFIERFRGIATAGDLLALVRDARGESAGLGGNVISGAIHDLGLDASIVRCHVCSGEITAFHQAVLERS